MAKRKRKATTGTKKKRATAKPKRRKNARVVCVTPKGAGRRGCAGGGHVTKATRKRKANPRRKKRNPGVRKNEQMALVINPRGAIKQRKKSNPRGFVAKKRRRNPSSGARGSSFGRGVEFASLGILGGLAGLAVALVTDSQAPVAVSQPVYGVAEIAVGGLVGGLLGMAGPLAGAVGVGFAGAMGAAGAKKLYSAYVTPSASSSSTTPATTTPATTTALLRQHHEQQQQRRMLAQARMRQLAQFRAVDADLAGFEGRMTGLGALEYER